MDERALSQNKLGCQEWEIPTPQVAKVAADTQVPRNPQRGAGRGGPPPLSSNVGNKLTPATYYILATPCN